MANFTYRTSKYAPKSIYTYKTFTTYSWNHFAPETEGNCTWFAFGETSRIVQECLGNEAYNIQYSSGNEFMTYGPNALLWISNAHSKGTWDTYGDTRGNYNPSSSPLYGNLINVKAGDILCYWASDGYGHVEVVERIVGSNVYCSGSKARASQPAVLYYDRIVDKGQFTVGRQHHFSGEDADGNIISWSNDYFQGVIRNPYVTDTPTPPTPWTDEPEITIYPSAYDSIMLENEDYIDFPFTVVVTGIPLGYTASGSNTYPELVRVANTGWSYTEYTGDDGNTYQRAQKSQTLRYYRESDTDYITTKYMYYDFDYPNGSASSVTPMRITVHGSGGDYDLITLISAFLMIKKNKKVRFKVKYI